MKQSDELFSPVDWISPKNKIREREQGSVFVRSMIKFKNWDKKSG